MSTLVRVLVAATAAVCAACSAAKGADDPNNARAFFAGKTLTYIVATDPGGGYDTYGRLVARHLARHLGLKAAVVRNLPGGGHIRGANAIYSASPDGLTIGTFNAGLLYAQLFQRQGAAGDLRSFSWIGKAGYEPRVLTVSARSPFRTLEDMRRSTRPILVGASGVGNESYFDTLLLSHALDIPVKMVFGMASREAQLAMLRGEIDAEIGALSTYLPFVRNGHGQILLAVGTAAEVPAGIPNASVFTSSPEAGTILDLITTVSRLLRWTAGPPGIPAGRLEALRHAYDAALNDPELHAEAHKLGIPIAPASGAEVAADIARILAMPDDVVARLVAIVERQASGGRDQQ
jgi:tripartite-type tricarboxylate transporter receptor subunit TctC